MYPTPETDVRHRVAVVFSQRSRDFYAAEAIKQGEIYTFTDAWGKEKRWLKGEYAYLAPNAASTLLHRCNLKHDWLEERDLLTDALDGYRAILIPNAGHLADKTIDCISRWLENKDGRLIVSGKTNLPKALLGLEQRVQVPATGYTGWHWLPDSPFGDLRAWEEYYVTGYLGHTVNKVTPAPGGLVLAELVEFGDHVRSAQTTTKRLIGPAIVVTERTAYIANQVFEFLGGMMQAHLNVEAVRHWANPTHWGDTIALFLRQLLLRLGLGDLWKTRLRSFGAYDGVLSFRHDVHGQLEFSFLDYQVQNLIPATYDIEDPAVSTNTGPDQARQWVERTKGFSFIEQALHNDSNVGDPPVGVYGTGLFDGVQSAAKTLNFPIYTCGRHGGGHMHPETIDAMDYLYANDSRILGLCTFSFYRMIEYGMRNPDVLVRGKMLTYATDPEPTISTTGFWFPFHAVVTTDTEWRVLRGWDRTHTSDSTYEEVETILGRHNVRLPGVDDQLENGVYSFQYHPQYARDPVKNEGRGTLDYIRYAINLAERHNLWIANQRQLYQRMADYQDLAFRVQEDGSVLLYNPTLRRIEGIALEQRHDFGSVWEGPNELIQIVRSSIITVPPLNPGERKVLRFEERQTMAPRIVQPNHKGLVILDARHNHDTGETHLLVNVCRTQSLLMKNVSPNACYQVQIDSQPAIVTRAVLIPKDRQDSRPGRETGTDGNVSGVIRLDVSGGQNTFMEKTIRITPA